MRVLCYLIECICCENSFIFLTLNKVGYNFDKIVCNFVDLGGIVANQTKHPFLSIFFTFSKHCYKLLLAHFHRKISFISHPLFIQDETPHFSALESWLPALSPLLCNKKNLSLFSIIYWTLSKFLFTFPELGIYSTLLFLSLLYSVTIRMCPWVSTSLIETLWLWGCWNTVWICV